MDSKSLMKIIHANDKEKDALEGFINKFGYKALSNLLNIALSMPVLSPKTKQALYLVDRILDDKPDALICLSKLTEIPLRSLIYLRDSNTEIKEILEHPEKFDLDIRQSYAFRCMNQVYTSYQEDLNLGYLQYLREGHNYEPDR